MIDIHSHILPGIDDGSRSMSMSLEMAYQAVENEISHMVCTPHIHSGYFDNTIETITPAFEEFKAELLKQEIPLSISSGAEIRVSEHIPKWLAANELPFIGQYKGKKVILLEMPHSHVPVGIDTLIRWLASKGVLPLIAHPERNRELLANSKKFEILSTLPTMFQLTAGSLVGRFGKAVEDFSLQLVVSQKVQVVASDTHNTIRRPNDMKDAYRVVAEKDPFYADKIFNITPGMIAEQALPR